MWLEDSTTEATRTSVEKKVCSFVEGDLDHATEMLSALWEVASKDEDIAAPASDTSFPVSSSKHFPFWLDIAEVLTWHL